MPHDPALTRRNALALLLGLPAGLAHAAGQPPSHPQALAPGTAPGPTPGSAPGSAPALAAAPAALLVELLVFRQPQRGAIAAAAPSTGLALGPVLGPLLPALHRNGYALLAAGARTLSVAANGTVALPFRELSPATGLAGQFALSRGQLLSVRLAAEFADCTSGGAIDERRRVRFGERHYFDSACLGALVAVSTATDAAPG